MLRRSVSKIGETPKVARKKYYFSAAIRGDTSYEKNFRKIIEIINEYGQPLTERSDLYNPLDKNMGKKRVQTTEKQIYRRDIIRWLGEANAVIAEISGGSVGVGYEIRYAVKDRRIPVFCLYSVSSMPSLIIKQDPSKYIILQQYFNEIDLEKYLRCFLMILTLTEDVEDVRSTYRRMSKEIAKSNVGIAEMKEKIESLLTLSDFSVFQKDLTNVHIAKFKPVEIDFKDAASFVRFMFRNIVLQKRWDQLKSQRIGSTFASGRKRRIIAMLSDFQGPTNLLEAYDLLGEDKLRYTREAFTKNIRAYRKIGLFKTPIEAKHQTFRPRGTKFKDRIALTRTFKGEILIESSRSPREIMRKLIIPTSHLQHLSIFLDKFGHGLLVDLLRESKNQPWFSKMPEIPILDIDSVDLGLHLEEKLAEDIAKYLLLMCKEFWKKQYSSFA
jgi:hypothetical protein